MDSVGSGHMLEPSATLPREGPVNALSIFNNSKAPTTEEPGLYSVHHSAV